LSASKLLGTKKTNAGKFQSPKPESFVATAIEGAKPSLLFHLPPLIAASA
jgi:hypothetical protein